jgi:hypothetical protein
LLARIVSGGQTGVDRAALDTALELEIPCGGWCPRDRWAEDGCIASRYPLKETPAPDPAQRTDWNVRDSDGTLVLLHGTPSGGTALTLRLAARRGRPCLPVDLARDPDPDAVRRWVREQRIRVLNVAGPRESQRPGIQTQAGDFLRRVLRGMLEAP